MRQTRPLKSPRRSAFEALERRQLLAASGNPTLSYLYPLASIPATTMLFDNFDTGGEGKSFHDTDATNHGGKYRSTAVDVEPTTDPAPAGLYDDHGKGYAVGTVQTGEFLDYTLNVATSAKYRAEIRFASGNAGGVMHIDVDGQRLSGSITLPSTGGWQNWTTLAATNLPLTAGQHTLRFTIDSTARAGQDVGNLNWFRFTPNAANPPSGTPSNAYLHPIATIPATTQLFADFDNGGDGVGYHDLDAANHGNPHRTGGVDIETNLDSTPTGLADAQGAGLAVGTVRAGEWLNYTTVIDTAGTYALSVRFATNNAGGTMHVEVDGKRVGHEITLAYTGGWQTWKTIQSDGIALPKGQHTIGFVFDSSVRASSDIGNFYWFRFAKSSAAPAGTLGFPTSWTQIANAPSPRFEPIGHVFNSKIYVFGGYKNSDFDVDRTYETFDLASQTWKQLGTLPVGMAETHITPVDDGKYIYFVGGFAGDIRHGQKPSQIISDKVWRYDPAKNTWLLLTHLPVARGAGGTALVGRKLHYIGGNPADRVTNVNNHYVLDLDHIDAGWTTAAPMPDAKDHFSTIVLGGKIYTIGGEYGHDELAATRTSVHVYDPATNKWTRLADLPRATGHAESSTFLLDGQIVIAGGQTLKQASIDNVFAYNPSTNRWSELDPLPAILQGTIVAPYGDKFVITMGGHITSQPLATTYVGFG